MKQIRVLIVEDSIVFRDLLVKSLNSDPALTVVATAKDPYEARDAIITYKPDVMTLDIELPKMNGIEFLRKLMPQYPIPVVMISSLSSKVFDALEAGAVDFVCKGDLGDHKQMENFLKNELPVKIKIASTAQMKNVKKVAELREKTKSAAPHDRPKLLAIGASTGGTEAISAIMQALPADMPGGIIVQHMPKDFTRMYAERVDGLSELTIREAQDGDRILPGQVLIAPGGDRQCRLVKAGNGYQVELREGPRVNGHCPSVDVLFESVAKVVGKRSIGIILTGMGKDGADGLLAMRNAGAHTIGQDEKSCVVYGMPKVAYDIGAVEMQTSLTNIAQKTYQILNTI